jgi:hypothetical protein
LIQKSPVARQIPFDITGTNLVATNVQSAIQEINSNANSFKLLDITLQSLTSSASYTSFAQLIFRGTATLGNPTAIKLVAWVSANAYDVRVVDITNALTIAEKIGSTNTASAIINLGTLSNLSSGEAIWDLQARVTGGVLPTLRMRFLQVQW